MAQYTPMGRAKTMEGLDRTITEEEYDAVLIGGEDRESVELVAEAVRYLSDMAKYNDELTEQQVEYAATDAWVCIRILEELQRVKPLMGGDLSIIASLPQTASEEKPQKREHPSQHRQGAQRRRRRRVVERKSE